MKIFKEKYGRHDILPTKYCEKDLTLIFDWMKDILEMLELRYKNNPSGYIAQANIKMFGLSLLFIISSNPRQAFSQGVLLGVFLTNLTVFVAYSGILVLK